MASLTAHSLCITDAIVPQSAISVGDDQPPAAVLLEEFLPPKTVGRDLRVKIHNSYIDHPRFELVCSAEDKQKALQVPPRMWPGSFASVGFCFLNSFGWRQSDAAKEPNKSVMELFKLRERLERDSCQFGKGYKSKVDHYVGVFGSLTHEHTGLNCPAVIHRLSGGRAWWSCSCPGWIEVMCTAFIHQPESSLVPVPNVVPWLIIARTVILTVYAQRKGSYCLQNKIHVPRINKYMEQPGRGWRYEHFRWKISYRWHYWFRINLKPLVARLQYIFGNCNEMIV